ncbi:MAG TPA: CopG family transcriptional regulator [Dehalococcoidia bacterium]|jgi:hypothetical protein
MTRTTISLPEELLKKARREAAARDISMAELVRRSLESALEQAPEGFPRRFKSVGMMASGFTDTAEKAGDMKFEPRSWR